ncbi:MAG: hypothetical protein JW959_01125 [Pirellulales bacterium]|nr:hypothetical protein [Pirellulales bacterium]
MHGCLNKWPAWALTAAAAWALAASALGDEGPMPTHRPESYDSATNQYVYASSSAAGEGDLDSRLAAVEEALAKIDKKAKDDKKKAAGQMSVTPGGRICADTAAFDQDAIDQARYDEQNGVEFRAARFFLSGKGFNVFKYKIEYDFAGKSTVKAKDVYIAVTDLPFLQNVKVGHFKEPFSLDELTSSRFITFMERNVAGGALAPARRFGVMAHGWSAAEYATFAIGGFAEKGDDGGKIQGDIMGGAVTMRGTWLPWYDEATEGRGLLHLGIAYSYRKPFGHEYELAFRPECHLASENSIAMDDVDNRNLLGTELAFVYGPFSFQSEYFVNFIDRSDHADCNTQGCYAYFSYFLTGENRAYDRHDGCFARVKPYENFFRVRDENGSVYTGLGAWELKYRYSWLDAYDHDLLGFDYVGDHTIGVNWYLTPYTRLMLEYIYSGINQNQGAGAGDLNIVQMRAQIDF